MSEQPCVSCGGIGTVPDFYTDTQPIPMMVCMVYMMIPRSTVKVRHVPCTICGGAGKTCSE